MDNTEYSFSDWFNVIPKHKYISRSRAEKIHTVYVSERFDNQTQQLMYSVIAKVEPYLNQTTGSTINVTNEITDLAYAELQLLMFISSL